MDVVVSRCACSDIDKSEVVACVRVPGSDDKRVSEVRTFTAFTGDVERLADWLAHVVMEATGQYGKPVGKDDAYGSKGEGGQTGCSSRHALVAKWEKKKRPIGRGSAR
jgi:hypothetical protein